MVYKVIYDPFIDYIRSHVCLCEILLYSKASGLCYLLLTVGWYIVWHASQIYMYSFALMMDPESLALQQSRLCDVKCIETDSALS